MSEILRDILTIHILLRIWVTFTLQGRRRRSGHGRTTFLAENGFGQTTIVDYSAENVFAFSTFIEVRWPN